MKKQRSIYKRVVLKLSGEALQGKRGYGIDPFVTKRVAEEIKDTKKLGVQIAIVIGGGNIYRGSTASGQGVDRITADYMGMLATTINGLALQDALEKAGVMTRVQTAIEMQELAEPYIRRKAVRHLEKERVVIFVAGTGNPYFSTDTAASLRAIEINADIILKATKVDGIYSEDPKKYKSAKKFKQLKYIEMLNKGLKVMDATAVSLCMDNKLPIIVFNFMKKGNIKRVILGDKIGTVVK